MAQDCMTQLATHRLLLRYLTHSILTEIPPSQEQFQLDCIGACVMFLLSLVQDNNDCQEELSTLLRELNLDNLMLMMQQIYYMYRPKGRNQSHPNLQIGFDLFILIT